MAQDDVPLSVTTDTEAEIGAAPPAARPLPPVLGRLLRGSFWTALRTPLQAVFALWTVPLIIGTAGEAAYSAYGFAWSFGFLQMLFEFGMSSALNRQVAEAWTRGDRPAVDRTIACGMTFYAAVAAIQAAVLAAIAIFGIPGRFGPESHALIVRLLLLQAVTSPCFGLSTIVGAVLQAARRYDFLPRLDLAIVVLRFVVLAAGLEAGLPFFPVVAAALAAQIALGLGPALWVLSKELGYFPRFARVGLADYRSLWTMSLYVFLIQLSVVLADRLDTTILGYALTDPEGGIAVYQAVSKPFLQVRQTGWTLTFLVMPAVASLAAAGDREGLEKVVYDGSRLLVALLLPVALLAALYARPFLLLWVPRYAGHAGLMRLFLLAAAPLTISVLVQASIGLGRVRAVALSALIGSLINLPLSFYLTTRLGVSGVIWGTVLTTLVSNGLAPGIAVFRTLGVDPKAFLTRTLAPPLAGAVALLATCGGLGLVLDPGPEGVGRLALALPFGLHLGVGCLAYAAAYAGVPAGRRDLERLLRRGRPAA